MPKESPVSEEAGRIGLATQLARLWAREGLTQAQFAERLNIRQHHVSEMENGRRSIGTEMAHCLGELFDILYRVFL